MTAPMPILDQDDLFIPLPDGTRLAARLWRPADGVPVPAILEYIPYRKRDNTLPRDETIHPWMAAQGYACLRVDIRGCGDSEGEFDDEYSQQELTDACAVIAWIAAQPWCTGAVGMMGKSWGAFNSLQVAALRPPALKAIVKVCGTVDRFNDDIHYKGGCLLGENFGWGSLMLSYSMRPADPMLRPDWRDDFIARFEGQPHLSERWSEHQTHDAYWRHGSVCEDYAAVDAAVLTIGGWNDNYMNAPAALARNLPKARALVGPWVHQYPHTAVPAPRVDFLGLMRDWWDHWLKAAETGAEAWPNYRVFMLDSSAPDASAPHRAGRWLNETLPSPRVQMQAMTLGVEGLGAGPAAKVTIQTPQTLGVESGEFFPMGLNAEMAGDQRIDDALSLCFDAPQPDGLALMGRARLSATITPKGSRGHLVARLSDVAPDGRSTRIAHGMLNLCHHGDTPNTLTAGTPIRVSLALDEMAYRLAPGHRLRLALSSTYWPFVWPDSEGAGFDLSDATLEVPVHDGEAPAWTPADAPPVPPKRIETLEPGRETRERRIDVLSGIETLEITSDSGLTRNPDHGLENRAVMTERWQIHPDDPLSARCDITWTQLFRRGSWCVETRVEATQTGSGDVLELSADLSATINELGKEAQFLHRSMSARVARRFI